MDVIVNCAPPLFSYSMTGQLIAPPYQTVNWLVYGAPDFTGEQSGYVGQLQNIQIASKQQIRAPENRPFVNADAIANTLVSYTPPTVGQALVATLQPDCTLQWAPGILVGTGMTQITGDVIAGPGSGSQAAEVVGLLSHLLPSLAVGYLNYTGTAWALSPVSGGGLDQLTGDVVAGPGTGSQAATVQRINGATVPVSSGATIGNALQITGAGALGYGPINLALAAAVTGVLALSNLAHGTAGQMLLTNSTPATAWVTASQDATISGAGAVEVTGLLAHVLPSFSTGVLGVASGAWTMSPALPIGSLSHGTAGQFIVTNSGATAAAWVTASQDATIAASGAIEVVGLLGNALPSLATGYLNWTGSAWALSSVSGGGYTSTTGDVISSGSGAVATTVVALHGTGSPAEVTVYAAGLNWNDSMAYLGDYPSVSGYGQLRLGNKEILSSNGAILNIGLGLTSSASYAIYLNGAVYGHLTQPGWTLGVGSPDFGGGVNVLHLVPASTVPTSLPSSAGDIGIYGTTISGSYNFLGLNATGILIPSFANISNEFLITATAAPVNTAGLSFLIQGGATSGTGVAGLVGITDGIALGIVKVAPTGIYLDAVSSDTAANIYIGATNTSGTVVIGNAAYCTAIDLVTATGPISLTSANVLTINAPTAGSPAGATPVYLQVVLNGVNCTIAALHA